MRWLLVEAAWRVATHKKRPETLALREWADRIARRRGMRVAVVALARKLGGIRMLILRRRARLATTSAKRRMRDLAEELRRNRQPTATTTH
jgi:hypothetical protein